MKASSPTSATFEEERPGAEAAVGALALAGFTAVVRESCQKIAKFQLAGLLMRSRGLVLKLALVGTVSR